MERRYTASSPSTPASTVAFTWGERAIRRFPIDRVEVDNRVAERDRDVLGAEMGDLAAARFAELGRADVAAGGHDAEPGERRGFFGREVREDERDLARRGTQAAGDGSVGRDAAFR